MGNIVRQDYWNKQYQDVNFQTFPPNHYIRKYINKDSIPPNASGRAFEIGCYPGRFLTLFGELGYELNGIDMNPDTVHISEIARKQHFKAGKIVRDDFMEMKENEQFDIVSSFGFVEHFTNLNEIIVKHARLVGPNGYLIIETPNFNGWVQHAFHALFDTPNLRRHVRRNMDPALWKTILQENHFEFEYLECGYIGGMDFWTDKDQTKIQNFFAKIAKRIWWGLRLFLPYKKLNGKAISRSCVLIAKRIG